METPGEGRSLQSSARSTEEKAARELAEGAVQQTTFYFCVLQKATLEADQRLIK